MSTNFLKNNSANDVLSINQPFEYFDIGLASIVSLLLMIGFIMVASSSMPYADSRSHSNEFYFVFRHGIYICIGIASALLVINIPMRTWQQIGPYLLIFGIALLILVLGVGNRINGSKRWLSLGPITVQVSELVKLFVITYIAGYLVRRSDELRTQIKGFIKPLFIIVLITGFLLLEPDFGAAAVIVATTLIMMYLAGAKLWQFIILTLGASGCLALVAKTATYRMKRLTAFLDPWHEDIVHGSGYQLTQSLIAFGRGEWTGLGLGNSIQKLSYLPEAHTDFVFAVWAEEFGLVGVVITILLFAALTVKGFSIGRKCLKLQQAFAAYMCFGISAWLAMQAIINIGVTSGALPTKGLTLPFISYGGSSLVVNLVAVAILLRAHYEACVALNSPANKSNQGELEDA
jgi:cell division protein FtsW